MKRLRAWVNVYRPLNGAMGAVYASRSLADQMAGRDRLACIEIQIPHGAAEIIASYDTKGGPDASAC
ncbi:hypothetical protein ACQR1I_16635 [Bradyrhizobium sp. HKCCYLS2038]|uniref:hypothetical protein n=1 Tax=unclassified Bradyrhizobium TaxID=2631580 RepID=UPI003EBEDA18